MPDVSAKSPAGQSSPPLSLDPAQVKISQRLETLKTTESGLTAAEAARRLAEYGPNALEDKTESKWRRLLNYFWGPLPWMIEAAALISPCAATGRISPWSRVFCSTTPRSASGRTTRRPTRSLR